MAGGHLVTAVCKHRLQPHGVVSIHARSHAQPVASVLPTLNAANEWLPEQITAGVRHMMPALDAVSVCPVV